MDFRALLLCAFLAFVVVYAEDAVNNNEDQLELQEDVAKPIDKRIPHPSWRTKGRIQHFQAGEMPPTRRFMSFNGPQRFYRYARRPFMLDFDW